MKTQQETKPQTKAEHFEAMLKREFGHARAEQAARDFIKLGLGVHANGPQDPTTMTYMLGVLVAAVTQVENNQAAFERGLKDGREHAELYEREAEQSPTLLLSAGSKEVN